MIDVWRKNDSFSDFKHHPLFTTIEGFRRMISSKNPKILRRDDNHERTQFVSQFSNHLQSKCPKAENVTINYYSQRTCYKKGDINIDIIFCQQGINQQLYLKKQRIFLS